MSRYVIGQKVTVEGLTNTKEYNGEIVTILSLPGAVPDVLDAYLVQSKIGVLAVPERNLSPFPPPLPRGRGDTDEVSNWVEFDILTGLDSRKFRFRDSKE